MRHLTAALILILTNSTASAETAAGRASVIDGDTLEIHGEQIGILDIDGKHPREAARLSHARVAASGYDGVWLRRPQRLQALR